MYLIYKSNPKCVLYQYRWTCYNTCIRLVYFVYMYEYTMS